MGAKRFTRFVTGHDAAGKSIVSTRGPVPTLIEIDAWPGNYIQEVWRTQETPAPIDNADDPTLGPMRLRPFKGGTTIRISDFPPESPEMLASAAHVFKNSFAQLGEPEASTAHDDSQHPFMHRTETVDYAVVLEGEIHLILDKETVLMKQGDVAVQRGTNHAWSNRSNANCRMLFILIDGKFALEAPPA